MGKIMNNKAGKFNLRTMLVLLSLAVFCLVLSWPHMGTHPQVNPVPQFNDNAEDHDKTLNDKPEADDAFLRFAEWLANHGADRAAEELGVKLARERRRAMKELMKRDPRAANARAIPVSCRINLPKRIIALLEKIVNRTGSIVGYRFFGPDSEKNAVTGYEARIGNQRLQASVPDSDQQEPVSVYEFQMKGIIIDNTFAMADDIISSKHRGRAYGPARKVLWFGRVPGDPILAMRDQRKDAFSLTAKGDAFASFECSASYCGADPVMLQDKNIYDRMELPGGGFVGEPGMPLIPRYGRSIRVPDHARVKVVIDSVDWVRIAGNFKVPPRQLPRPDVMGGDKNLPFTRNERAYNKDQYSFPNPVWIHETMRVRRREFVYVMYAPVSFNPVKKTLRVARNVKWHLEIKAPDGRVQKSDRFGQLAFAPIRNNAIDVTPDGYDEVLMQGDDGDSDDGDDATGDDTPADGGADGDTPPPADQETGNGADYLIITHDDFFAAIQPLADWKHKKGLKTRVVKTSDIANGSTDDGIITYIQNAYNTWSPAPTYVLLVGDHTQIPASDNSPYGIPSDLYYQTVDGSDWQPDVFVGRLPCSTAGECTTMVSKTLTYLKTPDTTASYWQTALTCGQFQDDDDNNGYEDRLFLETAMATEDYLEAEGYTVVDAYVKTGTGSPLRHNTSSILHTSGAAYYRAPSFKADSTATNTITNTVNSGAWLVLHRDHGYTGGGGWAHPFFYVMSGYTHVQSLTNGNKLPVVYSINCQTGRFDDADCFAEEWLKNPNGGAHVVIAATRNSYSWYNDWFVHGLFQCMKENYFSTLSCIGGYNSISYNGNSYGPGYHIGQVLAFGKRTVYDKYSSGSYTQRTYELHTLFGDPDCMLRTAQPQTLAVTHPSSLQTGQVASFSVTVKRGGSNLSGALVAIVMDPDVYETATTDGNGTASFSFTPNSSGDMSITVTEHNSIPYEGTITAAAMEVPEPISPADGAACHTFRPTFHWRDVTGVQYHLEISKPGTGVVHSEIVAGTTYRTVDLSASGAGQYSWRVRAYDSGSANYGPWSALLSLQVGDAVRLRTPGDNVVYSKTTINLGWYGAPGVQCELEVSKSGTGIVHSQVYGIGIDHAVVDLSGSGSGVYTWRVRGYDQVVAAYTPWSTTRTLSIGQAVRLRQPGDGTSFCDLTPKLCWYGAPGVSFQVEVSKSGVGVVLTQDVAAHTDNVTVDLSGSGAGDYSWRVRSKDLLSGVFGPWCAARNISLGQAIRLRTPGDNVKYCQLTPKLGWYGESGVQYFLEISKSGVGIVHTQTIGAGIDSVVVDLSGSGSGDYSWRVRSYDPGASAYGVWSAARNISLGEPVRLRSPNNNRVWNRLNPQFGWYSASGVRYQLEVSKSGIGVVHTETIVGTDHVVVDLSGSGTGVYTWRMRAYDPAANAYGDWSSSRTLTLTNN